MKVHTLKAVFGTEEYEQIRRASMRGQLNSAEKIEKDARSGEVSFRTRAPKRLCSELEKVVDFGATTAHEVLIGG